MKRYGGIVVAGLLLMPALASAQTPSKEFGVDIGIMYSSPDGGDGFFQVGTPVDIRIGMLSSGSMSFEPRFSLSYISDVGGDALWTFNPSLNLLFKMGQGTHQRGTYLTAGAGVNLISIAGESANQIQINGGIGFRRPSGSAATRIELFARYGLESDDFVSVIQVGARLGYSFFK